MAKRETNKKPSEADPLLDTKSAAKFLGVRPGLMGLWRYNETGPAYEIHWGHMIRYKLSELERYKAEMLARKPRIVRPR